MSELPLTEHDRPLTYWEWRGVVFCGEEENEVVDSESASLEVNVDVRQVARC